MPATYTASKLFSTAAIKAYDHDPGSTSAIVVSGDGGTTKNYVDMRDYGGFAVVSMTSVSASSSGVTLLEILAAEDATGTNAQVVCTSGAVLADAVGDVVVLECTAEQIKEVAGTTYNLRYVTARLTCSNSGDEAVVTFIRHSPRFPANALTANAIS